MIVIDVVIFIVIFFSTFLGMFRGFLKDSTSTIFWFFLIYFFINYRYFSSFYADIILNNENYLIISIIIFFYFTIKMLLNFICKKIIKQFKLLYINIILGSLFGVFRGIMLVFFSLYYINQYSHVIYLHFSKQSLFIHFFQ